MPHSTRRHQAAAGRFQEQVAKIRAQVGQLARCGYDNIAAHVALNADDFQVVIRRRDSFLNRIDVVE
jgi:hypothetical protein